MFHLIILLLIFYSPWFLNGGAMKHKVYTVNLVEIPGPSMERPTPSPAKKAPAVKKKDIITKKANVIEKKPGMVLPSKKTIAPKKTVVAKKEVVTPQKEETATATAKQETAALEAGGEALSLDSSQFPYIYYLRILKNKIYENWSPPVVQDTTAKLQDVVIQFKILKNGEIVDSQIEKSSGIGFFDQSALRAVILASPLPPLPEEFEEEFLGVHLGFSYKRSHNG